MLNDFSVIVLRPSVLNEGRESEILQTLQAANFEIYKKKTCYLDTNSARKYFDGRIDNSQESVEDISRGPVLVAIISHIERHTVERAIEIVENMDTDFPFYCSLSTQFAERDLEFFFFKEVEVPSNAFPLKQPALAPQQGHRIPGEHFPNESFVRDFIFRRSLGAGADLDIHGGVTSSSAVLEKAAGGIVTASVSTLQELVSRGLVEMAKVKPSADEAVLWLADWLDKHNPAGARPEAPVAAPGPSPALLQQQQREREAALHQARQEAIGGARLVDLAPTSAKVVAVDVSREAPGPAQRALAPAGVQPLVAFVFGGPCAGASTVSKALAEQLSMVRLEPSALLKEEILSGSDIGKQLEEVFRSRTPAPAALTIELLGREMRKHLKAGRSRFIVDGWPRDEAQLREFEATLCPARLAIHLDAPEDVLVERVAARARQLGLIEESSPIAAAAKVREQLQKAAPLLAALRAEGRLRTIPAAPAAASVEAATALVVAQAKTLLAPQVTLLLGGGPVASRVAETLFHSRGIPFVDAAAVVQRVSKADPEVARLVRRGKPVPSSLVAPLVVEEVKQALAKGANSVTLVGFPSSLQQLEYLQTACPCSVKALKLAMRRATLKALLVQELGAPSFVKGHTESLQQLERRARQPYTKEQKEVEARLARQGVLATVELEELYQRRALLEGDAVRNAATVAATRLVTPRVILVGGRSEDGERLGLEAGLRLCEGRSDRVVLDVPSLVNALSTAAKGNSPLIADLQRELAEEGRVSLYTQLQLVNQALTDSPVRELVLTNLLDERPFDPLSSAVSHNGMAPAPLVCGNFLNKIERYFLVQGPQEATVTLDTAAPPHMDFHADCLAYFRRRGRASVVQLTAQATQTAEESGLAPAECIAQQMQLALAPKLVTIAAPPGFQLEKFSAALAAQLGVLTIAPPEQLIVNAIREVKTKLKSTQQPSEVAAWNGELARLKQALETLRTAPTPNEPEEVPPRDEEEDEDAEEVEPEEPPPTVHVPVQVLLELTERAVRGALEAPRNDVLYINRRVVLVPGQPINVEHVEALEAAAHRSIEARLAASQGLYVDDSAGPTLDVSAILHVDFTDDEVLTEQAGAIAQAQIDKAIAILKQEAADLAAIHGPPVDADGQPIEQEFVADEFEAPELDASLFEAHLQAWRQTKKQILQRLAKVTAGTASLVEELSSSTALKVAQGALQVHVISADDRKLPEDLDPEELMGEDADPKQAWKPFPKGWDLALQAAKRAVLPDVLLLLAPDVGLASRRGVELVASASPATVLLAPTLAPVSTLEAVEYARMDRSFVAPPSVNAQGSLADGQSRIVDVDLATRLAHPHSSPENYFETEASPSCPSFGAFKSRLVNPVALEASATLRRPGLDLLIKPLELALADNLLGTVLLEGFPFAPADPSAFAPSVRDQLAALEEVARVSAHLRLDVDIDGLVAIAPARAELEADVALVSEDGRTESAARVDMLSDESEYRRGRRALDQLAEVAAQSQQVLTAHLQMVAEVDATRRYLPAPSTSILSNPALVPGGVPAAEGSGPSSGTLGGAIRAQPATDGASMRSACEQLTEKLLQFYPRLAHPSIWNGEGLHVYEQGQQEESVHANEQ